MGTHRVRAVLVAGNWMPWYRVNDGFFTSEASGNDLSAAAVPIFIIGGLILGGIGIAHVRGRAVGSTLGVIAAVAGSAGLVLAVVETNDSGILQDEGFDASIGSGLLLMILASLTAATLGVVLARRRSASRQQSS